MWPRTPEEHARGRNTGFVCFMNRDDAQEAMDAFQERDPLRSGRRMCLRWGKNVKKTVKRGTGGVPIAPIRKKVSESITTTRAAAASTTTKSTTISPPKNGATPNSIQAVDQISVGLASAQTSVMKNKDSIVYDEAKHSATAIRVIPPTDPKRLKFITTVASFVAKDGSILERRLLERESNNPLFSFLHTDSGNGHGHGHGSKHSNASERIFYRWRVYAFTQGDGFDSWREDPFIMIQPNGRFWIPPAIDTEKALREKMQIELKEDQIRIQQERRRKVAGKKKDLRTGRQLEITKITKTDDIVRLDVEDLEYWNQMIQEKLCASRDSICEAMAFCFDKSAAAQHISEMLKDVLMDNRRGVSVETKIARLYLMSDILYNSQQPGVKNAFRYRDAIEAMAKEVFKCLGTHGNGSAGRITMHKLRLAVKAVLSAWAKWSVYNGAFLSELEDLFEGRPITEENDDDLENETNDNLGAPSEEETAIKSTIDDQNDRKGETVNKETTTPQSIWVDKTEETEKDADSNKLVSDDIDGEDLDEEDLESGFVDIDDDLDGESLHDSDLEEDEDIIQ
eukprot:CAMPEP_0203680576 /NCGR_PEP_ID=MMETSP0090-20130426/39768_1 /ASSEMBLY_ACC=CAM_ASM_001088 /TAXON_ID=426623 /ORGANISM="Chaetoceros affinis, Strain CCMP159" /LENGTH=566 /DNA_ID=CAMNT_0050548703 /DNA_START=281 /DNA_END=1978 /DNA_ORIENTATION=+